MPCLAPQRQTAFTKGLNQPFFTFGDRLRVCVEMHAQPRPRPFVETFREPAGQPQVLPTFAALVTQRF